VEKIKLNFVPLLNQDQNFLVYRKLVDDGNERKEDILYRTKLPSDSSVEWLLYDISLIQQNGFEEFSCTYLLNRTLAEFYLFNCLKKDLNESGYPYNFTFPEKSKYKEVVFDIEIKSKGTMEIIIHPYFLKSEKCIGFLFQSKFNLNDSEGFNRKAQIESLSLDKSGKPNTFMYRDKEALIREFIISSFHEFCKDKSYSIGIDLQRMNVRELDRKSYMVGKNQISQSQFMGIKSSGPYRSIPEKVRYLFLFSERTRSLGRDVYLGLTGKLFPSQFPGLDRMFNIEINKSLVDHYEIDDFSKVYLGKFVDFLSTYKENHSNEKIMLVVILPKGFKGENSSFDAYGHVKLIALENKMYCQFVTEDTFYKKDLLKWSMSNIGLQIFSKLGGAPWLVKPAKTECLILGLGSSHEVIDGKTKKWFAYTVCLDSSGDFKYIRPLSSSNNEGSYLTDFKSSLRDILLSELGNHYKSFVLHLPFKIKRLEVEAIKEVVNSINTDNKCEVIVIRINTFHKFMGFSDHNTRVPYESSLVQLSHNMFLIWPEGLQYGKEVLHKRISEPLLVDFIEPPETWDSKKDCLQDILNLTGANWRGFNSKAQPISILYSKLIADFMKEFSHLDGVDDLDIVKAESVAPWFL